MHSNKKHTAEELEKYIQLNRQGTSFEELKNQYGLLIAESNFNKYRLKYQANGLEGLQSNFQNNRYSQRFKESIVKEFQNTEVSASELARKYNIPDPSTLTKWIIKYTKGEIIKGSAPKSEVYTMKGQKKTHEEKLLIVKHYLATGMSYKNTAEKYQVSYNQVYSWVQKYKKHGPDGLVDSRGRRKPTSIQSEEEKLRTEYAALKARNEFLETENAALKKIKEVERELRLTKQDT